MRRDRERKRRRAGVVSGLLGLLITAAVILGAYMLLQYLGAPPVQPPSAQTSQAGTSQAGASPTGATNSAGQTGAQPGSQSESASSQDGGLDEIQAAIAGMTLEEKVGQLVIAGIDGYSPDENTRQLIEKYSVGGFILFKKNIQSSQQLSALLNSLKEANAGQEKIPLFLSVDEEGGRVSRLPQEFMKFPSNKIIGNKKDKAICYRIGSILGEELGAFGFNMDFAPVLDINSNPKNPVIGDRSFGTAPDLVSGLGLETMRGIQSENVISVVKHFPGHGDTSVDSHVGLPKVNHTLERLQSFELLPFKNAIDNGADAVMVAHILLPKLDAGNPASFSKAVITDLLRNTMNFQGVVITDDFTMGAVTENFDMGESAVKSIQAGGDIVLVCHGFENQERVLKALLEAARDGRISDGRLDESVYRVLELKEKYALTDLPSGPVEPERINREIKELQALLK